MNCYCCRFHGFYLTHKVANSHALSVRHSAEHYHVSQRQILIKHFKYSATRNEWKPVTSRKQQQRHWTTESRDGLRLDKIATLVGGFCHVTGRNWVFFLYSGGKVNSKLLSKDVYINYREISWTFNNFYINCFKNRVAPGIAATTPCHPLKPPVCQIGSHLTLKHSGWSPALTSSCPGLI